MLCSVVLIYNLVSYYWWQALARSSHYMIGILCMTRCGFPSFFKNVCLVSPDFLNSFFCDFDNFCMNVCLTRHVSLCLLLRFWIDLTSGGSRSLGDGWFGWWRPRLVHCVSTLPISAKWMKQLRWNMLLPMQFRPTAYVDLAIRRVPHVIQLRTISRTHKKKTTNNLFCTSYRHKMLSEWNPRTCS